MQLVIEIDDIAFQGVLMLVSAGEGSASDIAIASGTPLPKGHGDLIDRDNIEVLRLGNLTRQYDKGFDAGVTCMVNRILDAPTILEADKESDANEKG